MNLDDVISSIVYDKDIGYSLLGNPDSVESYEGVVKFQKDECKENGTSIDKEGFQIGEPFNGDIEHAPILFLSSNPAFNFDEVSPRYFAISGKVFMPEHIDSKRKVKISSGEYSFDEVRNMFIVPQKEMSFEAIREFFEKRIQISTARNDKDQTLRIPLKDGGTVGVPYWTCVRNNTELLLPPALLANYSSLSQRAREIMKYAVCMEIVPFRTSKEIGIGKELLEDCWNKFTKHLLENSGASVIVLVGNKVLEAFTGLMKTLPEEAETILESENPAYLNTKGKPKHNGIVRITINNIPRLIVKVDFNSGKFSNFGEFFTPEVIADLQQAVVNSPLVAQALVNTSNN